MSSITPRQDLVAAFSTGLPLAPNTESHLWGALHQTLANPGSLIRAQFASEMGRAYFLADGQATGLAVAMEYFHTASLLLDDLPCMDDATQRRGVVCVHHGYGEAAAVLAALGLINRAYALLWRALADAPVERWAAAAAYVERCLGVEGVLNGQSQDLHYATLPPDSRSPQRVALGKTVSLIRLSLVLPALLGGAKPVEIKLLERLASFWGLSYQILDDLKDVFLRPCQTGKTAERDASLCRPNLALAVGAREAVQRLERLILLSDGTLARLIAYVPALVFLKDLSLRFREELGPLNAAIALLA